MITTLLQYHENRVMLVSWNVLYCDIHHYNGKYIYIDPEHLFLLNWVKQSFALLCQSKSCETLKKTPKPAISILKWNMSNFALFSYSSFLGALKDFLVHDFWHFSHHAFPGTIGNWCSSKHFFTSLNSALSVVFSANDSGDGCSIAGVFLPEFLNEHVKIIFYNFRAIIILINSR